MAITNLQYLTQAQRDALTRDTYVSPLNTRHLTGGSIMTDHYVRPDMLVQNTQFRARMEGIEVAMAVPMENVPVADIQREISRRMADVRARASDMAVEELNDLARVIEDYGRPARRPDSNIGAARLQEEIRRREMDMNYRQGIRTSVEREESQRLSDGQAASVRNMIKTFLKENLSLEVELVKSDTQIEIKSVMKFKDTNEEISSDTSFIDLED